MHRYAAATASLTFVLLLMGGLVHNTRSSLACPDWPLCYGQVMPKMEGGVAIEHSHRMVATAVGLLTIGLLAWAWQRNQKGLGLLALSAVVAQGVLGGLTVIFRLPTMVSTAHLALSQGFFLLLIYAAMRNRPGNTEAQPIPRARKTTAIAAGLVFAQMLLGALMRHLGAGLACVDVPLCRGSLWPSDSTAPLALHMVHRLFALLVLGHLIGMAISTARAAKGRPGVQALAIAAPALCVVQIGLGLLSITSFLGVVPVTAHLGVAALLLGDTFLLHLIARGRLCVPEPKGEAALVPAEVAS